MTYLWVGVVGTGVFGLLIVLIKSLQAQAASAAAQEVHRRYARVNRKKLESYLEVTRNPPPDDGDLAERFRRLRDSHETFDSSMSTAE